MYLIVITWTYVTLMMAVAEATSAQGSVLGAFITFVLYGLLPMSILVYILGTPGRKRALRARQDQEQAQWQAAQAAQGALPADTPQGAPAAAALSPAAPDTGREAPGGTEADSIPAVRKKP